MQICTLHFEHLLSNALFSNTKQPGASDCSVHIMSSHRIPRLPSNPELLLDYFDQLPSDNDSDSDFDGYVDENNYVGEQQLTYDDGDLELAPIHQPVLPYCQST